MRSPIKITSLLIFIIGLISVYLPCFAAENADARTHYILVSVAPYKYFVEKVAGKTVEIGLMVPAGASAHTYEPTPKEMLRAGKADAWFLIGESFEARASKAIKSYNPKIQFIDLRKGVDLISSDPNHVHHHQCSHHNCLDLHIWLSPRQSKIQAKTIAEALSNLYPENAPLYAANLEAFLKELDELDAYIKSTLAPVKSRVIFVSHPAYAYFCRDYDFEQMSIEFEGKDPTPQQLTKVLNEARRLKIKAIFIQIQYSNKGARLIADHIGAKVVNLDPYSENYDQSMREIARVISQYS